MCNVTLYSLTLLLNSCIIDDYQSHRYIILYIIFLPNSNISITKTSTNTKYNYFIFRMCNVNYQSNPYIMYIIYQGPMHLSRAYNKLLRYKNNSKRGYGSAKAGVQIPKTLQPTIEVSEWFCPRHDCVCTYNLKVDLKSDSTVIDSFSFTKTFPQWSGGIIYLPMVERTLSFGPVTLAAKWQRHVLEFSSLPQTKRRLSYCIVVKYYAYNTQ